MTCEMGWCRCAMRCSAWPICRLGMRPVGGSAREAFDGRGSLERVRVRVGVGGGMNKSFQCSGPVPGQAAKASKKRESLAPRKGRFPLHSEDEDRCTGQ